MSGAILLRGPLRMRHISDITQLLANIRQTWFIIVFCLLAGRAVANECPSIEEMVEETNICVDKINSLADMSLSGKLNAETRDVACKPYAETEQCVEDILYNCTANEEQTSYQQSTLEYMRKGFGPLCASRESFQRYTEMAVCFGAEYSRTRVCIEAFALNIEDAQKNGHDAICSVYQAMSQCMRKVIVPTCGQDAAEVLEGIIQVMRSVAVSRACPSDANNNGDPNEGDKDKMKSGATAWITPALTTSRHFVTFLLLLFFHARSLW